MASKRIQKIEVSEFKGINRSKSADDLPVSVSQVLRDFRITPDGTLERRQEYDSLYDDRPSEFEHTTPDTSSNERRLSDVTDGNTIERSHRRKNTLIGNNGTTEYAFACYAQKIVASDLWRLYIHRGIRSGSDIIWTTTPKIIDSTADQTTPTKTNASWIEASMQFNSTRTTIHFAVVMNEDHQSTTKVKHISFTTLYEDNFADSAATITTVGGNLWIESSTALTRDVDIELMSDNTQVIFFGKEVSSDLIIRTTDSDDFTTISNFTGGNTEDFHGFSMLRDTNDASGDAWYLTFTMTTSTNVASLRYQKFLQQTMSGGTVVEVTSGLYIGGGALTRADGYKYGACAAIDTDGVKHWVWRSDQYSLQYTNDGSAITQVTTDLSQVGNSEETGWDIVSKNGMQTFFLTDNDNTDAIYKRIFITSGASITGYPIELVEETNSETHLMFFNVNRTYEVNTAKRFSYVIGTGVSANPEVKFLHSDKGLFDHDLDGSVADAGSLEVQIESLGEPLVNDASGAMSQILILQCDDDKLYKRGNYHWDLLEGQRLVDNSDWESKALTVFGSNAHIWANHGTIRFGAGNEATNQAMWYDYVDRYFFENVTTADDGRALNYNDHLTRFSRLDPPNHTNMTLTPAEVELTNALSQNGYISFNDQGLQDEAFDDPDLRWGQVAFLVAFSFVYDGFQESQLLKQTENRWHILGSGGVIQAILKLTLAATGWNYVDSKRMNPRVTGLNVYLGGAGSLFKSVFDNAGWEEVKESVQYRKVKTIQISGRKPTGEDAFSNDPLKGTETWTDNPDDTWGLTTYVDYPMWQAALDAFPPVNARTTLGNALPIYVSAGSGTEIYTKESFVPEGYKYGIAIGNRTYIANTRINGTTRTNRVMVAAFAGSGAITPDHLSDFGLDVIDLDYDIQGLSQIGDDILVVVGTHGIDAFNVASGLPRKIEDVVNIGTDAPDSIADITEGGVGNILRGVLFKDQLGNVRLFDGFSSKVISDPVRDDFDSSNQGVISLDTTTTQYKYIHQQRLLFLAYAGQIFILDFRNVNTSGAQWLDWRFNDDVDAMAVGVDGELFFTDGNKVFVFPQTGTVDTPNPQWVSSSMRLPEDTRGVLKKTHVDYLSTGAVLQPAVFIDSEATSTIAAGSFVIGVHYTILIVGSTSFTDIGASANTVGIIFVATGTGSGTGSATTQGLKDTTSSLPISSAKTRDRKSFRWGTRVAREVKLELHGTTSTTDLKVHRVVQEIQIEKKIP
jgi:hypothetical protein